MTDLTAATTAAPAGARGRPRDPAVDALLLAAARDDLAEHGWSDFSIAGVAERAGVARTTVYRRWPGRVELAVDAVSAAFDGLRLRDHGSLAADIQAVVAEVAELLDQPAVRGCLLALLTEACRDADVRTRVDSVLTARLRELVDAGRTHAAARGEVPPGPPADDTLVLSVIGGALLYRTATGDGQVDAAFVASLATLVAQGLAPAADSAQNAAGSR